MYTCGYRLEVPNIKFILMKKKKKTTTFCHTKFNRILLCSWVGTLEWEYKLHLKEVYPIVARFFLKSTVILTVDVIENFIIEQVKIGEGVCFFQRGI